MASGDEHRTLRTRDAHQRRTSPIIVIDNAADRTYIPRKRTSHSSSDDDEVPRQSRPRARRDGGSYLDSNRSTGGGETASRAQREPAPSPAATPRHSRTGTQDGKQMSGGDMRKAAGLRLQQEKSRFKSKLATTHEYDTQGNTRWFLEANYEIPGEKPQVERFRVTEAESSLPHPSWLRDFTFLAKQDRQKENNLYENYFREKKKRRRN